MARLTQCPKIKFCGLTRPEDVEAAIESGADAIGFNFVASSPRFLATSVAQQLVSLAKGKSLCVGVFVNASPSAVAHIVGECKLDCVQLHGEESIGWAHEAAAIPTLARMPYIKAITWRGNDGDSAVVKAWSKAPLDLIAFLVDAYDPIQKGGTGKTARWDLLNPRPVEFGNTPILLAGGLNPSNIQSAISIARPNGVDLASGIESSPGIKTPEKMRQVVDLVRSNSFLD